MPSESVIQMHFLKSSKRRDVMIAVHPEHRLETPDFSV